MAKFSGLSLTTVPSLPSSPTKLRTTISLGHNKPQLLPTKFRYAPQQFNEGKNMRIAPTTITGRHKSFRGSGKNMPIAPTTVNDDFPLKENGELKVSRNYIPVDNADGLFIKYIRPKDVQRLKEGDQCLKDGQKVFFKYSICGRRGRFKKEEEKTITVGNKELGSGFDMAIRHMSTGEEALFVIPMKLWPPWQKLWSLIDEDRYRVYEVTSVNIMN